MHYGQYMNNPRTVRRSKNHTSQRSNHWSNDRYRTEHGSNNRSYSPYNITNRRDPRSTLPNRNDPASDRTGDRRRNPNFRYRRLCLGCGSSDYILRDRKCIPTLEPIKTNLVTIVEGSLNNAEHLTEEILTLHSTSTHPDSRIGDVAHDQNDNALERSPEKQSQVHFGESMYRVHEEDTYESQVSSEFANDTFNVSFISNEPKVVKVFDCSRVNLLKATEVPAEPAFCIDIGALKSVVGKQQLDAILITLRRKDIPRCSSHNSFRFGDVVVNSLGMIEVALATPPSVPDIIVLIGIVTVNVPALLGLDVLDSESLYADNVMNRLVHRRILSRSGEPLQFEDLWHVPIIRHDSHLY